ncbi:iron ABC transporter permease [Salipaludibacillus agaradhaerens]|uniref:ABC transporter permease n=1 Tax=Salipaludibacillus agaradhaerens TaxID=76935 RepID=UPI002150BDE0|nr:iron ABC transporter permease [Salipaludibacillus agaradhaerens]MCR6105340.1 iron ABC transporter permease [Salipaludibacillus agaradhaerens]MCR6117381.1 iron ABC transporter permease [Salipaludibacillus agaradhaerens]UJW56574.1 iron ABC transporter permease [Bacillus sp. A116_S68]
MLNDKKKNNHHTKQSPGAGDETSPAFLRFMNQKWLSMWNGNPPGTILLIIGILVALIMSIPIVYVIWQSLSAGEESWRRLLGNRIPDLLWNTLSLTAAVTGAAVIIGLSLAWFVIRTDLPGRKLWQWMLALPLVIPPYVGAVTYIIVFGPSGWLTNLWNDTNWLTAIAGDFPFKIYSFFGVFIVLTLFTYPYAFLIAIASLRRLNRNFEEVARSQGMSPIQVFLKVTLPFLRPAIGAGAVLISLYVLSDFGAIAMLRYVTFTAAIYYQRAGFDIPSASVLSLVLIILTILILWLESFTRKKRHFYQTSNTFKEPDIIKLGKWKVAAFLYVSVIFSLAVVLPLVVLIYWTVIGTGLGTIDASFFGYAWNSIKVSGLAAILCMLLAIPIIYLKSRHPSVISRGIDRLSYAGYALPGVIVALGMVFIFNNHIPALYNTFYMIAIAFVVRFLPQAMQSGEASLSLVSPRVDEAARSLGSPAWKTMLTVIFPSILPGILAGGALVFVSSIKELPATLMLRPPGFDTLAVRVYYEASEALYHQAAPAALLIVLVSIIPLHFLLKKY